MPIEKNAYRLGLYEKAMPGGLSLREKLAAVKDAGFDCMELSIDETEERQARLRWTRRERLDLRRAMEDTGCPIDSICLSGHRKWPLGSKDPATRDRGRAMFRGAVELAHDLGIRVIQLAGYDVCYEPSDETTRRLFEEGLREGMDCAARYGVVCGFETMETPLMDTVGKAVAWVRTVHSPYLGVYPDLGNLTNAAVRSGNDVHRDILKGAGHLFAMHLKETCMGQYRDMHFGEGWVDFPTGICVAYAAGVRYFLVECWHQEGDDWAAQIARAHRFIRQAFDATV